MSINVRRISTHAQPGGVALESGQAPDAVVQPSAASLPSSWRSSVVLPAPATPVTTATWNLPVREAAVVSLASSASRPTNGSGSSGGGSMCAAGRGGQVSVTGAAGLAARAGRARSSSGDWARMSDSSLRSAGPGSMPSSSARMLRALRSAASASPCRPQR
ncbi:hypothetical protein GCM10020001_025340 [Nonomuraea salmonea]